MPGLQMIGRHMDRHNQTALLFPNESCIAFSRSAVASGFPAIGQAPPLQKVSLREKA
tara:strand:- start:487 stop:657 length:171 start_codon:yes stop_codon:yes gene_type:complete